MVEICHHIYDQTYKYRNIASQIPIEQSFIITMDTKVVIVIAREIIYDCTV